MSRFVGPDGSRRARLILLGEAPGKWESLRGKPFVGPSGQRLAGWWRAVGLQRSDLWIDNVYPFQPAHNKIETVPKDELAEWTSKLHDRLAALDDPWIIVPTGNTALRALTGLGSITKRRGSIYEYVDQRNRRIKVIPTIHPAATFRTASWERRCLIDWKRIVEDSAFRGLNLPEREHFTKPGLDDIQAFVEDAEARAEVLSLDIETPRKIEVVETKTKTGKVKLKRTKGDARITCVGFSFEPNFSITIPTTLDYWSDPDALDQVWLYIRRLCALPCEKTMQNGFFDAWWLAMRHECPIVNYRWDTRWMHHAIDASDEHSLGYMASCDTREPYWKDEAKDPDEATKWAGDIEAFWRYNGKDAAVQRELTDTYHQRLVSVGRLRFYEQHYRRLFPALLRIMQHGVATDDRARRKEHAQRLAQCVGYQDALTALAGQPLTGPKGDFSTKKLAWFLYDHLRLPRQLDRSTGKVTTKEVTVRRLMLKFPQKLTEAGNLILSHRRAYKLSTFIKDGVADPDHRVRCSYGFVDTLRLSSSKNPSRTGQNLQNVDRELRHLYVADPGTVFVEVDCSQAESRVVYCLTGDPDLIAIARLQPWEFDDHNRTGGVVFKAKTDGVWPCGLPKYALTKDERYFGKKTRHSSSYGMRGFRMSDELLKEGFVRSPNECDLWIDTLLHRDKAILDWQRRVRQTVLRDRAISNGWGHVLSFEYERLSDDVYRQAYAFEPQSSVGILLNQYGLVPLDRQITRARWRSRINLQTHDSLTVSCPAEEAYDVAAFLRESLERPRTYYGTSLVIPVEVKIGRTWAMTKEFKRLPDRDEFDATVRDILAHAPHP